VEPILAEIRDFADRAHGDQKRKYTSEKYIVHPVRVMVLCKNYTDDITILAAALLHDVLEDTPTSEEEIKQFLMERLTPEQAEKTMTLVVELTDVYVKKDYPKLNRRKRKDKELGRLATISSDAQTIKYADIIDNSHEIVIHDKDFAKKFLSECREILKRLTAGNSELHHKAIETVTEGIKILYTELPENA
jgi:(p)ppGpp synthase/HD superfamily hydrolase